jgi:hypothetical protein
MIYRLKSRQSQIPNGFRFIQPQTNWRPRNFISFDSIVRDLIRHRSGRPDLVAKHGWSLDYDAVANEVEQFNVNICLKHGWMNYLDGGASGAAPPKTKPPSPENVKQVNVAAGVASKIWSGIKTLDEWIDSGEPPVAAELSEQRASVCAACPKNTSGDFTSWFTKPAAGAIKKQIERLQDRKLSTTFDAKLNVCDICLCPLKLKVHTPLPYIKAHMTDEVLVDLQQVQGCWIVAELRP